MSARFTIQDIKKTACAGRNQHLSNLSNSTPLKKNKFLNTRNEYDGKKFQSQKERDRYITLKMLQTARIIKDLECQVEFILAVEGKKVCSYYADFVYTDVISGKVIIEDVKSVATRKLSTYRIKKKLMQACYGITVREV